ncbi:MAG: CHAT domain-containing protein [Gemmatimonadales bacterium]|nr:CHAT domain-containing protein [Gemmatimonadales bacterium]
MSRISRVRSPSFWWQVIHFDKAFLAKATLLIFVLSACPAAADSWQGFLEGRIDLDEAMAGEVVGPAELLAEWALEASGEGPKVLDARRKQGVLLIMMGRPKEAIPLLQAALDQALGPANAQDQGQGPDRIEQAPHPLAAAFCLLHIGRALVHTRQVDEAGPVLKEALAVARKLKVPLWAGDAAIALSVLDRWAMNLDSSLAHRQAALISYQQAGYLKGQARARHYIGAIHVFQGELTRAMKILQEALATARKAEFTFEIASTLQDLAGVNFLLGDFDQALAQYEEAATLTNHPWRLGQLSNNQGTLLADQGRHEEALPYLEKALELMHETGDQGLEAEILLNLGRSQYELKDFKAGVANLDSALNLARQWQIPMTEAYALLYKGCAMLDQGKFDEAAQYLDEAGVLAQATGFFDIREVCHWAKALVARRRGDPQAALAQLIEGLAVINDVRRLSSGSSAIQAGYFSQTRKIFDELIDLLFELHTADPAGGYDRQALAVVQQAKARSFLDQMREADVDLRCQANPKFQKSEQNLLDRIATLEGDEQQSANQAQLEDELSLLEADLRLADPRYAELKYPRSCTLAEAQEEVLQPGELMLEFHLGIQASFLWSVSKDSFGFYRLPPAEEIERQVRGLLPMLTDYNLLGEATAYFIAQVEPLSRMLLNPVALELGRSGRVIVAGDGILNTLPFAVLLTRAGAEGGFSALPFLVNDVELSCAPSLSGLQRLRAASTETAEGTGGATSSARRDLVILAQPRPESLREAGVFARAAGVEDLPEVPFATEEIEGIIAAFAPDRVFLLQGAEATEEGLQAVGNQRRRFIHFTTHGLFNQKRPLYSGLVLEPGFESDGFLTVNEIFGLNLDCDQVVLSACSSGLGKQISGEGLVGMTRAFLYAGAGSVMAALWDVVGSGTASFMADYYSQLADSPGSAQTAALARTQRRMISGDLVRADGRSAAHPIFWAPFVITGGL